MSASDPKQLAELISQLSHELRGPLAPMVATLQIVEANGSIAPDHVALLQRQLSHLSRSIEDLLDLTRLAAGTLELDDEDVDVAQVIAAAVELSGGAVQHVEQQLRHGIMIDGDRARLARVIAALIASTTGAVVVSCERADERVHVTVRADAVTPALPFRVLAEAIVARLHGTLRADASSVTIDLPGARRRTPRPTPTRRILVVDDNVEMAAALQLGLEVLGHSVLVVHEPDDAVRAAATFAPELALVDLRLRESDGYDLARRLLEVRKMRLIAISGNRPDLARARAAGFEHHFMKPLDLHDLKNAIG